MRKETAVTSFNVLSGICLEGWRKTTRTLSENSRCVPAEIRTRSFPNTNLSQLKMRGDTLPLPYTSSWRVA
jgi:hypothetical protein